jgi:hypothetical protein
MILRSKNVGWVNGLLMTLQMEKLAITIPDSNYKIENYLPINSVKRWVNGFTLSKWSVMLIEPNHFKPTVLEAIDPSYISTDTYECHPPFKSNLAFIQTKQQIWYIRNSIRLSKFATHRAHALLFHAINPYVYHALGPDPYHSPFGFLVS